jgi:hypothetical protein
MNSSGEARHIYIPDNWKRFSYPEQQVSLQLSRRQETSQRRM